MRKKTSVKGVDRFCELKIVKTSCQTYFFDS